MNIHTNDLDTPSATPFRQMPGETAAEAAQRLISIKQAEAAIAARHAKQAENTLAPQHAERLLDAGHHLDVDLGAGVRTLTPGVDDYPSATPWLAQPRFGQAILYPWYDLDGEVAWHQLRPDRPGDGQKYISASDDKRGRLMIHPIMAVRHRRGEHARILLVEGTNQYLTAVALYADDPATAVFGTAGCWGWSKDSTGVEGLKQVLAVETVEEVIIAFDADRATNRMVYDAADRLFGMCVAHSRNPKILTLPTSGKNGFDDWVASEFTTRPEDGLCRIDVSRARAGVDNLIGDKRYCSGSLGRRPAAKKAEKRQVTGITAASLLGGILGEVPDVSKCAEAATKNRTHFGLAERVAIHYGDVIAYRPSRKAWFVYDGRVWKQDEGDMLIKALVRTTARSITVHEAAAAEEHSETVIELKRKVAAARDADLKVDAYEIELAAARRAARDALEKFGESCENGPTATNTAVDTLKSIMAAPEEKWDQHPFLINFPNGTVNIKHVDETGEVILRAHDPADRITMITAVDYVPDATTDDLDRVRQHLDMTAPGTFKSVLRWLGYSATGAMDAKTFLNVHGAADAAKSTLFSAAYEALGGESPSSYSITISPEVLGVKDSGADASPELDACRGKRMILISEAQHAYLASDLVKRWTGGDPISTRTLYSAGGQWRPRGKFTLIGNGPTSLSACDVGMVSRLYPIEVHAIPPALIDTGIKIRLESTVEGLQAVLRVIVKAARAWYADYKDPSNGLNAKGALLIPEGTDALKAAFLEEVNPLTEWLEAATVSVDETTADNIGRCSTHHLYTAYCQWTKAHSGKAIGSRLFGKNLSAAGYETGVATEFTTTTFGANGNAVKGKFRLGIRLASEKQWREILNA